MNLSRIVSSLIFIGTFVVGVTVGYLADDRMEIVSVEAPAEFTTKPLVEYLPVEVDDLVGVWKGTWGYNRAPSSIKIDRTEGNKFFGTLTKGDARIALVGTIDVNGRTVTFKETKILEQDEYGQWSLGSNSGTFSPDGRTLTGTGTDEWGTYGWEMSR